MKPLPAAMETVNRLNPLLEVLKSAPRRVNKIFIQKERGPHRVGDVIQAARDGGVPYLFVPKVKLDQLTRHHQGVVAFLAAKEFSTLADILSGASRPFLVLLDEVEDPQNLGAIIRSAEAAGVDGLVLPERRSAGLTEAVATVSAGALSHLKVARVVNLAQTMDELKRAGVWLVGAEACAPKPYYAFDYTLPVAIVMGSEAKGLRSLVRQKCDQVLSIPLRGRVNSLNVASATAVFLFEVLRQRLSSKP